MAKKIPLDKVSRTIFIAGEMLGRTWQISLSDPQRLDPFNDKNQGRLYVFWHAHLLPLAFYFRNTGKSAVVSESTDGKRAAAVAQRWGHAVIHGSSSHGGMLALRACARELRNGANIVMTPDGPHGPREQAKPGIAHLALIAGAPVIPVAAVARMAWRLRSWDRFSIPMPFTPITIKIGEPVYPQLSTKEPHPGEHLVNRIQKALASL
ncbi:MAG: lysophospholipid acyltransferase family protein [Chitinispirillaceae bacterium]|nr:lysophospholipid acyltransferase family protein [Chitinispirillaceae bacterium]